MLAVIAAIIFGIQLLLDWTNTKTSDAFTWQTLITLGLLFLALHLAGVGSGWTWRTRPYRRRRL
jgi:hypothetical protein